MSEVKTRIVSARKVLFGDKEYLTQRPNGLWHLSTSYEQHSKEGLAELRSCIDAVLSEPAPVAEDDVFELDATILPPSANGPKPS